MTARPQPAESRPLWPLWTVSAGCAVALIALAAYEYVALGWHPAREQVPLLDSRHLARVAFTAAVSAIVVAAILRAARPVRHEAMPHSQIACAAVATGLAAALTLLFAVEPRAFSFAAREDGAIEWVSALLLFGAAGLCAVSGVMSARHHARTLDAIIATGLAALLFLTAMEEISWAQRVVGFDTPETLAEHNWQGEFNFHNLHTDISELGYYFGAGLFLTLGPLIRRKVPDWAPIAPAVRLLPGRFAAAAVAPAAIFTYGHWNLLPIQLVFWLTVLVAAVFARDAAGHGRREEAWLFSAILVAVPIGQLLFLLLGHRTVEIFDSTEFREFFLALGLACYACEQSRTSAPETVPA